MGSRIVLSAILVTLLSAVGCGSGATLPRTSVPPQPTVSGPNEFSKFGFTWVKHQSKAPGSGSFLCANATVSGSNLILTLDGLTLSGAEVATVTPLSFGTYTFTFFQDTVESGSVASGFLYSTNSVTEIDVEQQGQYSGRWDFTNWQTTSNTQTSDVTGYDASKPHKLEIIWEPTYITWYIDGIQVAYHTQYVPQQPAPFLFSFWTTNSTTWGGRGTPTTRRMIVTGFDYTGNS